MAIRYKYAWKPFHLLIGQTVVHIQHTHILVIADARPLRPDSMRSAMQQIHKKNTHFFENSHFKIQIILQA